MHLQRHRLQNHPCHRPNKTQPSEVCAWQPCNRTPAYGNPSPRVGRMQGCRLGGRPQSHLQAARDDHDGAVAGGCLPRRKVAYTRQQGQVAHGGRLHVFSAAPRNRPPRCGWQRPMQITRARVLEPLESAQVPVSTKALGVISRELSTAAAGFTDWLSDKMPSSFCCRRWAVTLAAAFRMHLISSTAGLQKLCVRDVLCCPISQSAR